MTKFRPRSYVTKAVPKTRAQPSDARVRALISGGLPQGEEKYEVMTDQARKLNVVGRPLNYAHDPEKVPGEMTDGWYDEKDSSYNIRFQFYNNEEGKIAEDLYNDGMFRETSIYHVDEWKDPASIIAKNEEDLMRHLVHPAATHIMALGLCHRGARGPGTVIVPEAGAVAIPETGNLDLGPVTLQAAAADGQDIHTHLFADESARGLFVPRPPRNFKVMATPVVVAQIDGPLLQQVQAERLAAQQAPVAMADVAPSAPPVRPAEPAVALAPPVQPADAPMATTQDDHTLSHMSVRTPLPVIVDKVFKYLAEGKDAHFERSLTLLADALKGHGLTMKTGEEFSPKGMHDTFRNDPIAMKRGMLELARKFESDKVTQRKAAPMELHTPASARPSVLGRRERYLDQEEQSRQLALYRDMLGELGPSDPQLEGPRFQSNRATAQPVNQQQQPPLDVFREDTHTRASSEPKRTKLGDESMASERRGGFHQKTRAQQLESDAAELARDYVRQHAMLSAPLARLGVIHMPFSDSGMIVKSTHAQTLGARAFSYHAPGTMTTAMHQLGETARAAVKGHDRNTLLRIAQRSASEVGSLKSFAAPISAGF